MSEKLRGLFSRHAKSLRHKEEGDPASEEYSSLTQKGVEQSREAARRDLLEIIREAPEGTVLFIGGKSDQERTGHTGEIYGDELKNLKEDGVEVITKKDIDDRKLALGKEGERATKIIEEIIARIQSSPETKFIVDYPLLIKQLSYGYEDRWTKDGGKTDYFKEIVDKYNGSHAEAVHDWVENQGELELDDGIVLRGPKPDTVAKEYLEGLKRMHDFARTQLPERSLIVHGVGHQWDLDAVVTYLAKGEVNKDTFEEVVGGEVIGESEFVSDIIIDPDGQTSVKYRGREFILE